MHCHASTDMHQDAPHQEIDRELSHSDGRVAAAFQQCWQEEKNAVKSCV